METTVYWFGYVGGWLLFAGPVYQALLELLAENEEVEGLKQLASTLAPPPLVSRWWWLLPPVAIVLGKRRRDAYRRAAFATLDQGQSALLLGFMNKATAWSYVAGGALLIALKETYELWHHREWADGWLVPLVLVPLTLALVNAGVRVTRSRSILERRAAAALAR